MPNNAKPAKDGMRKRQNRSTFDNDAQGQSEAEVRKELEKEINRTAGLTNVANFGWILAFYGLARFLELPDAFRHDHRIDWDWLMASMAMFGCAACIALYCITYLQGIKGIRDYETHAPWTVPAATVIGICAFIAYWGAIWPCFRWWTFLIVPATFMAYLSTMLIVSPLLA